ncbi:electron transfer flavoprotein subunit alpha/FixB family protein [Actinotalea fermentans]|uniref:Electron transfer flavoprotein subunit alpha n=1 Tax=Actinotalea fermentans TaxID=43671 RepID=A0A511YT85_9CELL|nr:electron transfer flavoprotein subunit alpha/FixB family protein [Actinotalea fermentans]GEN78399.1 electron transfer flavoprotein subunit alpha [Actinotalea fermentans]
MSGSAIVLVVVEQHGGTLRASATALLTAARALGEPQAVWFGAEPGADALAVLGAHGARVVHVVPGGDAALPDAVAAGLAELAASAGADVVLLASGFGAKEVAARLALATDAALMVDASAVERGADGRVVTTQQAFAASWTLRSAALADRAVVTMRSNAVRAVPLETSVTPEVATVAALLPGDGRVRVVERTTRPTSDRPDVGEATVVVVGGRGTQGDFSPVEDLADALGAAVGATRDATDEGWMPHEAMVGQTGQTISPRLYVGAGVSGAIHHRGGMQASGTIVAVNADPDAPIFEFADFGVVGDLFEVLPQAAAEIRRLRAEG